MATSRRIVEQQKANTYMTNLRITSDVGQVLPGGDYVEAHDPKVVKVHGYDVPKVMAMVRTEQEKEWLVDAEVEYNKRLEKYRSEFDVPEEAEKAEMLFGESVQSVFHQLHSDGWIHPLLTVERQCACKECEELFYAVNGEPCPKCKGQGEPVTLPPPKQIEQYDQTNVLLERLLGEFLPKMQAQNAELMTQTIHATVEGLVDHLVEKKLEEITKPGGKSGKK